MFVELHLLQNFAPSCLNRDDTNSPKDCEFGGYRRARISSQCFKKAVRDYFRDHISELHLATEELAVRTKRLVDELADSLTDDSKKRTRDQAMHVAEAALGGLKIKLAKENKTQYLLFFGKREIAKLAKLCSDQWDALSGVSAPGKEAKSARKEKQAAKESVPAEVSKELEGLLDGGKAVDLALFGRMLADLPDHNIDAACQVAHAITTNSIGVEQDYFTAVDDLKPEDTAGSDMIGTVEFTSGCFYRYAVLDLPQLKTNLQDDEAVARKAVEAFLRAAINAIPTGKQNTFAAHNPPSLILAVVRDGGSPWSLANAFVKPVSPAGEGGLVADSVKRLDGYFRRLVEVFDPKATTLKARPVVVLDPDIELAFLKSEHKPSEGDLVATVMGAINFPAAKQGVRK